MGVAHATLAALSFVGRSVARGCTKVAGKWLRAHCVAASFPFFSEMVGKPLHRNSYMMSYTFLIQKYLVPRPAFTVRQCRCHTYIPHLCLRVEYIVLVHCAWHRAA